MSAMDIIDDAIQILKQEAAQLRLWAVQSKSGGWSTNHVEPMRKRADALDELVHEFESRKLKIIDKEKMGLIKKSLASSASFLSIDSRYHQHLP